MIKLNDDVINIIFSFYNPYKDYFNFVLLEMSMKNKIKEVKQKQDITLNFNGVDIRNFKTTGIHNFNFNFKNMRMFKNIYRCVNEIKQLYSPIKTFNEYSYLGKHHVEDYRRYININNDIYISNGEFIISMLISGYKFKHNLNYGPNMTFNAKRNKIITKYLVKRLI